MVKFSSTITISVDQAEQLRSFFIEDVGFFSHTPLGDILTEYGWDYEEHPDGSYTDLFPRETSQTGPQDWMDFCSQIAPFVESGKVLEYLDEGWERYRFLFEQGNVKYQKAIPVYRDHILP